MVRTRGISRKGYSLVELAVVLTVGTVLLAGMVSWLVSLGSVAEAGLREMGNNEVVLAEGQLSDDIVNMAPCGGTAENRSKVREVSSVLLSVDSVIEGEVRRVSWRYNPTLNTLERAIVNLDDQCAPVGDEEWVIWVRDVGNATFTAIRREGTDKTTGGVCVNAYVSRCILSGVTAEILLLEDVGGSITHHAVR